MAERVVGYFMYEGKPYSVKTGKELKSVDNRRGRRYVQLDPVDKDVFREKRSNASKVRSEAVRSARARAIPDYAEYVAKTRKGNARTIGTAKDSYLGALNSSYAILQGIPLNKDNRKILNQVYQDEIKNAIPSIAPLMEMHKNDWVTSKSKKYWKEPFSSENETDAMAVRSSRKAYEARKTRYGNVRMHEGLVNPFA